MRRIQKPIHLIIILAILFGVLAPVSLRVNSDSASLQLALAEVIAENPDKFLRVIVQKTDDSNQAEYWAEFLGGEILKELALINAFVAKIPARNISWLLKVKSVEHIALDARMLPANLDIQTVRDEFNLKSYDNNDGTQLWMTDWVEFRDDETDTPFRKGSVRIRNEMLRLRSTDRGIQRTVDLTQAEGAVLTFDFLRSYMHKAWKFVTLEVSTDGGNSWVTLDTIGDGKDSEFQSANYDLAPFLPNEIILRFTTSAKMAGTLKIDNLQVEYSVAIPDPVIDPDPPFRGNTYLDTTGATLLHEQGITGHGITVAVIDSGIDYHTDISGRLIAAPFGEGDAYGHGTHVAGIIGGDGFSSNGELEGMAPGVDLINLRVSDENGGAYEFDVVEALQWVHENQEAYNIRIINLSLNSSVEDSYHNSGLDAAVEILWFNGVVVVASAGNKGPGGGRNTAKTAPANDPYIIVVGASDEKGNSDRNDDSQAPFSAHGSTTEKYNRPDLLAPGTDIYSTLSPNSPWGVNYPDRLAFEDQYIRLSGTSMATPVVSGAVALMLSYEPDLTPDQVKYRLLETGSHIGNTPYLYAYDAVFSGMYESYSSGATPHMLLAKMAMIAYWASVNGDENIDWENVSWEAVNWNAVNWNAVNWNAVNWNAVNWNAVNWNAVNWNAVNWNAVNWNAVNWNAVNWNAVNWNAVNWNAVNWNAVNWNAVVLPSEEP